MPNITICADGEEYDSGISDETAALVQRGLESGTPFSFTDTEGMWNWLNPDRLAFVYIEKD